jgi:hypothetical protein
MNLFKRILSSTLKEEPSLLACVKSALFLAFFLIAVFLSFDRAPLLFYLTVGGMTVYAILIIVVLLSHRDKER